MALLGGSKSAFALSGVLRGVGGVGAVSRRLLALTSREPGSWHAEYFTHSSGLLSGFDVPLFPLSQRRAGSHRGAGLGWEDKGKELMCSF